MRCVRVHMLAVACAQAHCIAIRCVSHWYVWGSGHGPLRFLCRRVSPLRRKGSKTSNVTNTQDKVSISQARVPCSKSSPAVSNSRVQRATPMPVVPHMGQSAMLVVPPHVHHCSTWVHTPLRHRSDMLSPPCAPTPCPLCGIQRSAQIPDTDTYEHIRNGERCPKTTSESTHTLLSCFVMIPTIGFPRCSDSVPPGRQYMRDLSISGCVRATHHVTLISSLVAGGARVRGLVTAPTPHNRP